MKRFLWILIIPVLIWAAAFPGTLNAQASEEVKWYSLEEAQQLAKEHNKKVFIYAMAQWCGYCKKVEKEVYPDETVIQTLAEYFFPVKLDIESDKTLTFNGNTMTEAQFARQYRVTATPTFFFLDAQGEILGAQPGYIPADTFIDLLAYVGSDAYTDIKFEEYLKQNKKGSEDGE